MKRLSLLLALTVGFLMVGGCFLSDFPLEDSSQSQVSAGMVGDWVQVDNDKPLWLVMKKFNEHEYLTAWGRLGQRATFARAFSSEIDGVDVMNVQDIQGERRVSMFYKYMLTDNDQLIIYLIKNKPLFEDQKFDTPEQLRAFVTAHIHDEAMYGKPITFQRHEGLKMQIVEMVK